MTTKIYVGETELPPGWVGPLIHVWTGVTALDSESSKFYKGNQNVSSAILSGSDSSTGGSQTSQTITIPDDGTYDGQVCSLVWVATYQGKTDQRWLKIVVPKKEER